MGKYIPVPKYSFPNVGFKNISRNQRGPLKYFSFTLKEPQLLFIKGTFFLEKHSDIMFILEHHFFLSLVYKL